MIPLNALTIHNQEFNVLFCQFAVVDGLLPTKLVSQVQDEALETLLPLADHLDFGSCGKMEFPTALDGADKTSLFPTLSAAAAQLLDIPITDLRLLQSDIWLKRGKPVPDGEHRAASDNTAEDTLRYVCATLEK